MISPAGDIKNGFLDIPDDLNHLKFIDAQAVRALAKAVNTLTPAEISSRKIVIMLATGGTLAMHTENDIRTPHADFKSLLDATDPRLKEHFLTLGLQAFNIDSSQMNYRHVRELAVVITYLWREIKIPFVGFLIAHGTDTMLYAAAAMSLIMGPGLPFSIVYTGSQRPAEELLSDAPINIRNALYTLEALHTSDMAEVVIVMGELALLATSAEKVDDMAATAYEAPRHRYIATYSRLEYPIQIAKWLNPRRRLEFLPTIWDGDYSHTLVIQSALGLDPAIVAKQVTMPEIQAVILYSYGAGTIYEGIIESAVIAATKRDIPVFVVNPVHTHYRVEYLSSLKAIQAGAIPLDMTLSATLAKIEIALRLHPNNLQAIAHFMTTNYVGEIPTESSRFQSAK